MLQREEERGKRVGESEIDVTQCYEQPSSIKKKKKILLKVRCLCVIVFGRKQKSSQTLHYSMLSKT